MSLASTLHLLVSPYAFALAVPFLGAFFVCCATAFCAFSCALRNIGAFSHGFNLCTISLRFNVISLAARACVRGIPYLIRYDRPSNPWSLRCLPESCLRVAPHSRHVTVCLVILFLQWTGFDSVSGVAIATRACASSCAFRAKRLVWVC